MASLGDIREQIDKDLHRTYSEIEFFSSEETLSALRDILIVWAGKNFDIDYVQGMNEIVALIYLVVYEDSLAPSSINKDFPTSYFLSTNCSDEDFIRFLNDLTYVKADTYAIFSRLMKFGVKHLYNESPFRDSKMKIKPNNNEIFFDSNFNVAKYSLFYCHCYRIFFLLLKLFAPEVYDIVHKQSIEPPVVLLYSFLLLLDDGSVVFYPANST